MEGRLVERIAGRFVKDPVKFPDYEMERLATGVRQCYADISPEVLCSVLRALCANPQRSLLLQSTFRLRLFNLFLEIHEMPTPIPATFALSILLKMATRLEMETGLPPKAEIAAELELCRKLATMVLNCRHLFTRCIPRVLEARNHDEEEDHPFGLSRNVEMRESSVEIIEDNNSDVEIIEDTTAMFEPEDDEMIVEEVQKSCQIGPAGDQPPKPRRSARLSGASISEVDASADNQSSAMDMKSPKAKKAKEAKRKDQKYKEPVASTSKQSAADEAMVVDSDSDQTVTPPKSPVNVQTWSDFQPDHTASSTIATLSILHDTALVATADAIGPVPKQGVRLTDDDIDKIVALFG